MDHNLQIWVIVVTVVLIASVFMQIFIMGVFIRLLAIFRPKPGQRGLQEFVERATVACEHADRAIRTTAEILDHIKPVVNEAASVSLRQLSHADQVVEEVLTDVDRMHRDVTAVRNWPVREARALSAGVTSAMTVFFRSNGSGNKGKRW